MTALCIDDEHGTALVHTGEIVMDYGCAVYGITEESVEAPAEAIRALMDSGS